MEKNPTSNNSHLPADFSKRMEMVVAACIGTGFVNRHVLAQFYGLSQLEASSLLRDFLHHRIRDVRWDAKTNSYKLVGYPVKQGAD